MCLPKRTWRANRMYGRHQDHDEQERDQQALDQLDRPDRHRPSSIRRSSTSRSSPIPLDALTRTTSPGASRGRRASSAAWRSATSITRPAWHARGPGRPADRFGSPADDDQQVDHPGGQAADLEMARLVTGAQLEHLTEDRHPAAGQAGQDRQGRAHRRRRGVVAVVQDRHVSQTDQVAPVRRRRADRQAGGDLVEAEAGGRAHGGRRQRVVDGMATQARQDDRPPTGWGPQDEAHAGRCRRLHGLGSHLGRRPEAVGQDPGRRPVGHPGDPLVVGVEDGRAAGRERLDELGLGLLDRLDRADPRQVDRLDRRHDADPRPADPGQVGDLAADVHAHLQDERLVRPIEAEDRQRQADLVVLVALAAQGPEADGEDRADRLLGRCLGDAPGDSHRERVEAAAPAARDRPERVDRPADSHDADLAEHLGRQAGPADQDGGRPVRDRLGEVLVAVGPLAGQGHEEVAGQHPAGVDGRAADRPAGIVDETAATQPGELGSVERLAPRGRRQAVRVGHGGQCPTTRGHGF